MLLAFVPAVRPQGLPPELHSLARAALEAREQERYEEAAAMLEEIARAVPTFAPVHLNLGLTRHEQGDYEAAAAALQQALELQPNLPDVRPLLGFDLVQIGSYREAAKVLEKAVAEEPDNLKAAYSLGVAYLRTERPAQALQQFRRVAAQAGDAPDLLRLRVQAHAQMAAELTDRLIESAPDSIAAKLSLAEQLTLAGRHFEAIELYRAVVESAPERRRVRLSLGDLLMESLDYAGAEELYRQETALRPFDAKGHARLGEALLMLGRSDEAVEELEASLSLRPDQPLVEGMLGKALFDLGRLGESEQVLLRLLEDDLDEETEAKARYQLGQVYLGRGERGKAADQLRRFRELKSRMQPVL